jgi:hypothetical protein
MGDRGGATDPGRRRDDQDLGVQQLFVDARPVVVLVDGLGLYPGRHVVVGDADGVDGHAELAQLPRDHVGQQLGVRRRRRALQAAVQDEGSHGSWRSRS